jgi:hypothetical protein
VTLDGFENKECQECEALNRTYYLDYYDPYGPDSNVCPIWIADLDDLPGCTHEQGGIYFHIFPSAEGCEVLLEVSNYCSFRKTLSPPDDCFNFGALPMTFGMDCCANPNPDYSCKYCGASVVVQGLDTLPS